MTACIVDASMIGPLILPDEAGELHDGLLGILSDGDVLVPGHWRLEVANLGRMGVRKRRITPPELRNALEKLRDFAVSVDDETDARAWGRTFALSEAHDLTMYDAAYLELAVRTGARLLTRDGKLRRAAEAEAVALS